MCMKQMKIRKPQQRNESYKEEPYRNFRIEENNNWNKMLSGLAQLQKRRGERIKSMNWKMEKQKLTSLNNREKKTIKMNSPLDLLDYN